MPNNEPLIINGRDVFIVDHHHEVLSAWVRARKISGAPLPLVTFDWHTDVHEAFLGYGFHKVGGFNPNTDEVSEAIRSRLSQVNVNDDSSVMNAVSVLRHDEHIDCALKLGVISHAYIFLSWNSGRSDLAETTVFNFEPCYQGCSKDVHDDDCNLVRASLVLDDRELSARVNAVGRSLNIEKQPFILDIDLDVFNTRRAVTPDNPVQFHRLIHHATIITIAREKQCVEGESCRLEDGLTVEYPEREVKRHIEEA